jgi:hypothetical protein
MSFNLRSNAFREGQEIPTRYTCQGENISPQLSWEHAPKGTMSFVLIVDDPDAPDPKAPKMTYVHWLLYNIPSTINLLPENEACYSLPKGTREGLNDWKRTGYGGPCPPIGRHRYFHKLYALDVVLEDLNQPAKSDLLVAMGPHVLAEAVLVGTYQKK